MLSWVFGIDVSHTTLNSVTREDVKQLSLFFSHALSHRQSWVSRCNVIVGNENLEFHVSGHLSFRMFWLIQWDSRPVSTFMVSDSAVFKDKFFPLINFFICLVCRWTTQVLSAFIRGHNTFEFGKRLKNFKFFSFSSLPKLLSTLQKFAGYMSAIFKQSVRHMLSPSSLLFSRNAKITYETTY